jgi:TolA-binding protein
MKQLRVLHVIAMLSVVSVAAAHAQQLTLASIEELAASGRLTDARTTLDRWHRANPASAHALLLEARLAVDAVAAEAAYQAIALSYPTSPHAPEALLRLGQGLVAAAELGTRRVAAARAATYLERLISDYPRSPYRAHGQLWLVRAHTLVGSKDRACTVAREALNAPIADEDLAHMVRVEFSAQCDR